MKRSLLYIIIYIWLLVLPTSAQHPGFAKLSPWLRKIALKANTALKAKSQNKADPITIAFISLTDDDDDEEVLTAHGCRSLARFGHIHIASIPVSRLTSLSADRRILRIEASPSNRLLNDSMAIHLNATDAYAGSGLPRCFDGEGVVVGVMDIGFDLTHPTFFSRDLKQYRISRLWDQLSTDTVGSPFPVGRDYTTREELLALGHSLDGQELTHGTHTLGTAAGSGFDSPYAGMAPGSDICIVANAVSDDIPFINPDDLYKYTYATDALGFKYIFDYARQAGKPCVISFSEGSPQDFRGYDQLYYAILDSLTGPGRIIVSSAGNEAYRNMWFRKPAGKEADGAFLLNYEHTLTATLKADNDFTLRLTAYGITTDSLTIPLSLLLQQPDSTLTDSLCTQQRNVAVELEAYPSCYDASQTCIDLTITSTSLAGYKPSIALEVMGSQADVEVWMAAGWLTTDAANPTLTAGEPTHCVLSPSSAPSVISVGSTTYRDFIINAQGDTMAYWRGSDGQRVEYSSVGPAMDGRRKPDVMAPGNNIISAFSSYYMESHPDANDLKWSVAYSHHNGRTYPWTSNSGTSMASPAVGGAIALWLQACPTLSPQDVLAILERTCSHPDPMLDYPNNSYGYGLIDVYAGLLDILGFSAIGDIPATHTAARISADGHQLSINLGQASDRPLPLRLYDLTGHRIVSRTLPKGVSTHTVALPLLPAGIYAVCVDRESTLIRINH